MSRLKNVSNMSLLVWAVVAVLALAMAVATILISRHYQNELEQHVDSLNVEEQLYCARQSNIAFVLSMLGLAVILVSAMAGIPNEPLKDIAIGFAIYAILEGGSWQIFWTLTSKLKKS